MVIIGTRGEKSGNQMQLVFNICRDRHSIPIKNGLAGVKEVPDASFSLPSLGMNFQAWARSFKPGHEVSNLGMKCCTRVQNFTPEKKLVGTRPQKLGWVHPLVTSQARRSMATRGAWTTHLGTYVSTEVAFTDAYGFPLELWRKVFPTLKCRFRNAKSKRPADFYGEQNVAFARRKL
jgi:hypothetical protein